MFYIASIADKAIDEFTYRIGEKENHPHSSYLVSVKYIAVQQGFLYYRKIQSTYVEKSISQSYGYKNRTLL